LNVKYLNISLFYELNNEVHGDDQLNIFQVGEYVVATVTDGVSECSFGRVASIITTVAFEEFFRKRVNEIGDLEDTIVEGIKFAGQELVNAKKALLSKEYSVEVFIDYLKRSMDKLMKFESTAKDLIDRKINQIKRGLSEVLSRGEEFTFETVFAAAVFHKYKVYTAAVGDVEMYLFRNGKLIPHFVSPKSSLIDSYLSADKGIVGTVDVACRRLERGDVFILATDGAFISYSPPGGVPYAPFIRTLTESIKNGKDPAQRWLSKLKSMLNGELSDDLSLIIAVIE